MACPLSHRTQDLHKFFFVSQFSSSRIFRSRIFQRPAESEALQDSLSRSVAIPPAVTDTTADKRQILGIGRQPMKKGRFYPGAPADVNLIPGVRLVDEWRARGR